jgi:uncharacterized protein YjiS (DUF1127 family)
MSAITAEWVAAAPEASDTKSVGVFRMVANRIKREIAIRRNRWILHDLPDAMLNDIGIDRSQINRIVAERIDHAGNPKGPYPF